MSTALSWVVDDLELKNAREHKEIARLRRECREVTRRCHGKSQKEKDMEALERRLAEEERRKAAEEMDTLALLREHERLKAEKQKGRKLDGVLTKLEKQIERERRGVTVPNPGQTLRRKDTMARTGTRPATLGAGPSILEKAANCRGGMKGAIASMRAGMMAVKSQASIIRMLQKDNDEKVKKNKEEEEICKRKPRYLHGLLPAEEEYLAAQCANARGKRKGSAASDESLTFQEVRDIMKTCGMKTNMNIRDLREMSARYRSEGHKGLMQDAFLAFIFKFRLENMKMFESVEWRLQDDGGQVTASETAAPPKRRPRPGVRPVSGIRRYTDPADLPFLVDIRRKPPDVRPAPKTRPSTAWAGERSNTQGQERDGQVDSELRQRPTTALGRPAGKEDGRNGQAVSDKGAIGADSNTSAVKRPATSLGLRTAGSHGEGRQREVSQLCDRYLTFRKTAFAARPDEGDRSRSVSPLSRVAFHAEWKDGTGAVLQDLREAEEVHVHGLKGPHLHMHALTPPASRPAGGVFQEREKSGGQGAAALAAHGRASNPHNQDFISDARSATKKSHEALLWTTWQGEGVEETRAEMQYRTHVGRCLGLI